VKRFLGIAASVCILTALLTVGASAAENDALLIAPAPAEDDGVLDIAPAPAEDGALDIAPAPAQPDGYTDVSEDHWAIDAIRRYTKLGALQGNPDGSFEPDSYMTCAQFASFVSRAFKLADADLSVLDGFEGADTGAWYAQALANCVAAGVIGGSDGTSLSPDSFVTREQAVVMLCGLYEIEGLQNVIPNFIDGGEISLWARPFVAALSRSGVVRGYPDKTFRPDGCLTRAEAVHLAAEMADSMVGSGTYELAVKLSNDRNGSRVIGKSARDLTDVSGVAAELCYMVDSGVGLIGLFFDSELVDDLNAAAEAFYAGGEVWREYGKKISASLSGSREFIDAFVSNAGVSTLQIGKEYNIEITTELSKYYMSVTVNAN